MSFIDDILDFGSNVVDFVGGNSIGGALARTAITGLALNQITKSINKDNASSSATTQTQVDYGVREQVDPNTDNVIPVVYGQAYIGGSVTDAQLVNSNQTMWYCLVLCEKTGVLMSDGLQSVISFDAVYWNELKVNFRSDGITVASFSDESGTTTTDPDGLIQIYPFSGGSNFPVKFTGYGNGNGYTANSLFPEWTTSHTMSDLVFALVRVDYNRSKNITGLGKLQFKLSNSMKMPGDCLYDYMTNTRYGAGIGPEEINQ